MFDRHRFFRAPWRDRPFQKGDFKYVILDLLQEKPRYGYEIIRAMEERSHGMYTPSAGTVYPTLQMLEEMGYVSASQQEGKKVYTITDEGQQFLREQLDSAEQIRSQMRDWWDPEDMRDIHEIMHEFGQLARLLRRHGRRLSPEKRKRVREVISNAYSEAEKIVTE